jgi:hypothetical protein
MIKRFTHALVACAFLVLFSAPVNAANNANYEQRRTDYIDSMLAANGGQKLILQAYQNAPLDTVAFHAKLNSILTGQTSDFDIIEMVRILYFSNGAYDAEILPVLNSVPYWINNGDTTRNYWSENHMIMWMSSDWLLHEKYNKPIDANLRARVKHYLELKVRYGFYEFYSSVYNPYSLSGILNLADFAQDAEIQSLARQAAQHLLTDLLRLTNDKGTYFPVAGRNYPGKYESAYGQNHNNLIWLLTGMGQRPNSASAAGPFLSTSTLPVDTVIASWQPVIDMEYFNGHSLDTGLVLNSTMSPVDKVIFQWSSGAYFHPAVVSETVQLLEDSNMWNHVDFALLQPIHAIVTPQSAVPLAESLSCISKSSVNCGENIQIFKHNSITLASVPGFWPGKVGFQQHTCVANVGTTPVYLGSGEVHADWEDRNPNNANVHLPMVQQKHNLALLMYRPETTPQLLGATFTNKDVALRFKAQDFDEVRSDSAWLLGRQGNGYVAVRRNCLDTITSNAACHTTDGQTWVIMVGDSAMYGSFSNFENLIQQSQFETRWYFDTLTNEVVYYSKITVDTIMVDYRWGIDTSTSTGVKPVKPTGSFNLYPNPANTVVNIDLSSFAGNQVSISIMNALGQQVYFSKAESAGGSRSIDIQNLPEGIYLFIIENGQQRFTQKLIKQ